MRFKRIFFLPNPEQIPFPSMSQATLFRHAHVVTDGAVRVQDVLVDREHIVAVGVNLAEQGADAHVKALAAGAEVKDCTGFG